MTFTVGLVLLLVAGLALLILESNLPSPLVPEAEVARDGGKLFKLKTGRLLEYFDSGAPPGVLDAPVLVMVHGGFQTGDQGSEISRL